ncbi:MULTISPECIES: ORC-CDC6 family AAA ATPase [Acinetobacter]|jgi:hypothetical protein|uniref:Uncharacterized protein n=1 Tax=Acinetobacter radioresistens TaxID=40216 RepID=A0A8H2PV31_ACIRA|nr:MULTISPECIES: hypothetical protein [Acinetobacter]EXB34642.1 hypothetical protein J546_0812 [Acinetobacter sp. 1461402]EXB73196.1 hypothetical protein J550_1124 [Acinetobacter sp. 230853]PSD37808.1 hypothetical protein C7E16_02635 [Acinetobacter radioresistens]PSD39675.1 hypothetical protein C7E21_03220 [Acinetobacter radioresistens]TNX92172.1 hypothetical protein FHY67_08400 [Acinetobacter radioresistens]
MSIEIANLLSNNRTEHIGLDVWSDFVVPYNFNLNEFYSLQPIKLEGGRGSGKTMILRYLSHYSQFSPNRDSVPNDTLQNIGIYLKADTQFMRLLQKRGFDEAIWSDIFEHYLNLIILIEVLSSLISIKNSNIDNQIKESVSSIKIECLENYNIPPDTIDNTLKELKKLKGFCEKNVLNPKKLDDIEIFSYQLIKDLIEEINSYTQYTTIFHIFIDEYENLLEYQQKIINARMKHSEPPINYNIAIKCNGAPFIEIIGSNENLNLQHDFIAINLDNLMMQNFEVFASEILLSRLSKKHEKYKKLFSNIKLNETDNLTLRSRDEYQNSILQSAREILPSSSQEDLANEVFSESQFYKKLLNEIDQALKGKTTNLTTKDFIDTGLRKELIVCSSILYRNRLTPDQIFEELIRVQLQQDNDFEQGKEWTANNFIGSYIRITKVQKHKSTFYAGLTAFTKLANGNIRYFLELCRSTFSNTFSTNENDLSIPKNIQHQAALETSELFFKELDSMKPVRTPLKSLCLRLGTIFSVYHDRNSQSEPEINHFTISDPINIGSELQNKINDAVKWGIVYQTKATKEKDANNFIPFFDYVLNPIFSPHFYISYRKKRKIKLSSSNINMLFDSNQDEFMNFIKDLETQLNPVEKVKVKPEPESITMYQDDLFK